MAISLSQKVQYNLQTEQIDSTESITYPDTRMVMKIVTQSVTQILDGSIPWLRFETTKKLLKVDFPALI